MELQQVSYEGGGRTLRGWLADGSGGTPAPAILVAHEAPGVNDNIKARVQRLAERGYVAMASDMYGQDIPIGEAIVHHEELMSTPGLMLARARSALDTLMAHPNADTSRAASIGFCQGGIVSLELARSNAPIVAAVGFHPGFKRPQGSTTGTVTAKVLMMIGDDDPVVPQEDRVAFGEEMKAAGADWQLHVFGGVGHTYTNPMIDAFNMPGFAYSPGADKRSWKMMLDLFDEIF